MLNKKIKDFSENTYSYEEFLIQYKDFSSKGYKTYIGSDSQVIKDHISMVTSICLHKYGHDCSSKIFYIKERFTASEYSTLKARMMKEAYQSLEVAMALEEFCYDIEIHLDVGDTFKNKTSTYHKELKSLITSQGYICETKPNSWASSAVADRMSKD